MAQARSVRNLNLNLPVYRGGSTSLDDMIYDLSSDECGSTSLDDMIYDLSSDEYAGKKSSVKYKGPGNSVIPGADVPTPKVWSDISSKGKGLYSGTARARRKRG